MASPPWYSTHSGAKSLLARRPRAFGRSLLGVANHHCTPLVMACAVLGIFGHAVDLSTLVMAQRCARIPRGGNAGARHGCGVGKSFGLPSYQRSWIARIILTTDVDYLRARCWLKGQYMAGRRFRHFRLSTKSAVAVRQPVSQKRCLAASRIGFGNWYCCAGRKVRREQRNPLVYQ